MDLNHYGYFLPEKNLALTQAEPRDSSRLFVYDIEKDLIAFDYFFNLDKYLPENSFMVLNNTKVLPARVAMKKSMGGKVIVLFLVNELTGSRVIRAMVDRKIKVGEKLYFDENNFVEIINQKEHLFDLKLGFSREKLFALLKKYGTMPIPLYLKKSPLKRNELLEKYQTIFAKIQGSSAAPTASLHFTDRVFGRLDKKRIKKYFITLHVGLGTFAPITNENIKQKKLHKEYLEVDSSTLQSINRLKRKGKILVAAGTTTVRTLESISQSEIYHLRSNIYNETDLFIFPPYNFKMVDILITNFHLPKSSLMMLVEAFLQYKKSKKSLVELYKIAIKNEFRFYSFGDAMLII